MNTGEGNSCEGCPFHTKTCGTKGPEDSPFVIIGESPGTREVVAGKPFVGPSGILLKRVLKEAGFDSLGIEPYYINAINCLPPQKKKDLRSMDQATRACHGRVKAQLNAHPRKVVLALGFAAAWAATGDFSIRITQNRGEVRQSEGVEKGTVLTYHPAFLMRNGSAYTIWRKDVQQAVKLLKDQELGKWSDPTWAVIDSPSTYKELVEEYVVEGGLVTGDVETDHLHWMRGRILCLGITKGDGSHVDIIPEQILYGCGSTTKKLMEAQSIKWNWHNGLFDIKWFRYHGIQARVDEDTMMMSYTLNENRGFHGLDDVAQHWIGAPRHKGMVEKYLPRKGASYRHIPPEVLYEYAAKDISKTHCQWFPLREAIRSDYHAINEYRTMLIPAINFIANMQLVGITADVKAIEANVIKHEEELAAIREKINVYAHKHIGADINPNSPAQVSTLLYDKLKLGPKSMGTSENALIQLKRNHEHPLIDLILDHREVAKRKGTYVANILPDPDRKKNPEGFIQHDGRIHADYKLHGTATGRLAGSDPNMLNQPRGPLIRSQFIAAPRKILVEVDLNQAELRSLALMSGDPLLMEIYTKNEVSIHDVTTGSFYAPKEQVLNDPEVASRVRRMLMLPEDVPPSRVYGEAKMRGKAVNFGIVYGREAYSLSREFDIPIAEAQRWIDQWLGLYSGAAEFIEWCRSRPLANKSLVTVYGRKKRPGAIGRDTLRNLQNEFANFPHQSTASDIMLETAIEVQPVLVSRWNAHIWNELYDAIYYEVDAVDDYVRESVEYVQGVITRVPRERGILRVPFLGDAKIGYTWGSMVDYNPAKDTIEQLLGKRNG